MGKLRDSPMPVVAFVCPLRLHKFEAEPDRTEDAPDRPWHPWAYFAACPTCGDEAKQAGWQRALLKAWVNSTGPRTPEGIAATAKNLEGHPTPEEALRTRFNNLKHGLFARTATYFPARPGKYAHCNGCSHLAGEDCLEVGACLRRTELFLKHHIAFDRQDPTMLLGLRADTQAAVQALVDDMILAIASEGVQLKSPKWYVNPKTGGLGFVEWEDEHGELHRVHDISGHPLLKPLAEFLSRNNLNLDAQGMTPRAQDDNDLMTGHLDGEASEQQDSGEFRRQLTGQLDDIRAMIERSQARTRRDPILIEQTREESGA